MREFPQNYHIFDHTCIVWSPKKIGNWMTTHFNLLLSLYTGWKNGETPQEEGEKKNWGKFAPWICWKFSHFIRCRFPKKSHPFFHPFHSGQMEEYFTSLEFLVNIRGLPFRKASGTGRVRSLWLEFHQIFVQRSLFDAPGFFAALAFRNGPSLTLQIYGTQFFHPKPVYCRLKQKTCRVF